MADVNQYMAVTGSVFRPPWHTPCLVKWEDRRVRVRRRPNIAHNAGVVHVINLTRLQVHYRVYAKNKYVLRAEGVPPNITDYSYQEQAKIMETGEI